MLDSACPRTGVRPQFAFVDVDDTIREVHGYAKQAAAYGYSGVRGLNVQLATLSTEVAAPVIVRARLRRGNVASHTGAGQLLAQALRTTRTAGVAGPVLCRADSAYYGHAFVATALRHGAWFSVTVRMNPQAKAAIAGIAEDAWTPIKYPHAVWERPSRVGLRRRGRRGPLRRVHPSPQGRARDLPADRAPRPTAPAPGR